MEALERQVVAFLWGSPKPSLCSRQWTQQPLRVRLTLVQILPPAFASCEALDKSHHLSRPQFFHLKMGISTTRDSLHGG